MVKSVYIVLHKKPTYSYETSTAVVLPATWHRQMHPH